MRSFRIISPVAIAVALAASSLPAQAPAAGWRAEYLRSFSGLENKFVTLAQAMPWDKYNWRPAAGVRSICESYLHIAGANYMFVEPLGATTPSSVNLKAIETCPANKEQVVATLKASFAHLKAAVNATSDAEAEKAVNLFGMNMTKRGLLLFAAEHAGETLGQSIAYARSNGVVPPWNAKGSN